MLQAGYDKYTAWQPDGNNAAIILDVVAHSWKEAVDAIDVTHTGLAGAQGLLAGILRGDGMMRAVFNTDQNIVNGTFRLRAGQNGMALFFYGPVIPFSVPCMVIDVTHQSEVAGRVEWTANVRLNKLAGTGTYTRHSD